MDLPRPAARTRTVGPSASARSLRPCRAARRFRLGSSSCFPSAPGPSGSGSIHAGGSPDPGDTSKSCQSRRRTLRRLARIPFVFLRDMDDVPGGLYFVYYLKAVGKDSISRAGNDAFSPAASDSRSLVLTPRHSTVTLNHAGIPDFHVAS